NEWSALSLRTKRFSLKAAVLASLGGLLFGYDLGVIEGALPQLKVEFDLSVGEEDFVVSAMILGSSFGGILVDRVGRWTTIMITAVIFIVSSVMLMTARTKVDVCVGRYVVGCAVALSTTADVSYLTEVAPRPLRGAMVSAN
ncbi:unnamed protein product, partial [Discosporangium mesarthrocarpum]